MDQGSIVERQGGLTDLQPVEKMGDTQWIAHILKRLHLLDEARHKREMDGITFQTLFAKIKSEGKIPINERKPKSRQVDSKFRLPRVESHYNVDVLQPFWIA